MHKWQHHRLIMEHAVWRDMHPRHLAALEHCAQLVAFEAGDWMGRVGDSAEFFYLLTSGTVDLLLPLNELEALKVMALKRSALIGWSWLYEPNAWQYDVRARTQVDAIAFDVACVRGMMSADHELGYQLMRRFGPLIHSRQQHIRDSVSGAINKRAFKPFQVSA